MSHCFKCSQTLNEGEAWHGLHKKCFKKWFNLEDLVNFSEINPKSQSLAPLDIQAKNSRFFHGKFRKYSSRLNGVSYILKVEQNEYLELPCMEFLCNQIYNYLRVPIPDYYLIRFPEKQTCFVTKNFMHDHKASTLDHIYHYLKMGQEHNCENLVHIIRENTKRRSEEEKFVYLTLADSLTGNNDRHGRNLGFIRSSSGIVLAPFYDNPSALSIEEESFLGADLQPKGCIYTKDSDEPSMQDYISEWRRLGYEDVIEKFKKNLSLLHIQELVKHSFISEKRQNAFVRLLKKRNDELCKI